MTTMESSKDESQELSEVEKVLTAKKVNVTYTKKVKFEKGSKFLAISTNRIFILAAKLPHKIESSFHILEIQSIESTKSTVVQIKFTNEKQGSQVITTDQDQDVFFIVAHLVALMRYNFPGGYKEKTLKIKVEPAERSEKISNLSKALANSTSESEVGPCGFADEVRRKDNGGLDFKQLKFVLNITVNLEMENKMYDENNNDYRSGFSLSYASICDLYGQAPMAEVMWDIDKIYGSHGCKEFNISDFDHLETKELVPVIATFELNSWFKSFSCQSHRLGSELVDVLVKVLKLNISIEELNLFDCRLQKESLQKLFQAIASNPKTALKKLNFGKNAIEDKGTSLLCNALTSLPHGLESLLLHDMNITAKNASSICAALKGNKFMSSTLTSLNLSSNPLKSDGASAICELLANSNVVRELDLSNAECSLELVFGAIARGGLLHLKSLNLSGIPSSYRKGKENQLVPSVNKFFSSSMVLEDVSLSNTKISPEVVKSLLVGLITNTVIKDLSMDLSRNEFRSAGAAEMSSCIAAINNVSSLDLTDNGLDMDLITLCQNIQKNKSLKNLNLSQNIGKSKSIVVPLILESIVEMIASETLPLNTLCLSDCRLKQDSGILIDSLGTNETLKNLDISGNLFGDEGARLLAKALQINTKLRKINIDRNGITLKGYNDIATALERNYSLQLISTPFNDISHVLKHNSEAILHCFKRIEKLLLRNRSTEHNDQDRCLRLKQNLLLNSLDQESTDYLLVKVQDSIADLRDVEGDEAVAKEVEMGKESIKDADKMKQVLFKMFVEIGNHSKEIEERTKKITNEMIEFANELVKKNITDPLNNLKDQCPSIAENKEALAQLEKQISEKGMVDGAGVNENIARTIVNQVSSKVKEATLNVASAFAEQVTNIMQENLTRSQIKLNFLSMEYQEKQKNEQTDEKKDASVPTTPVDDKDESSLAVQKAKNRISTQLLQEEGSKGTKVKRRPTFNRVKDAASLVEVEISLDDAPNEITQPFKGLPPKIAEECLKETKEGDNGKKEDGEVNIEAVGKKEELKEKVEGDEEVNDEDKSGKEGEQVIKEEVKEIKEASDGDGKEPANPEIDPTSAPSIKSPKPQSRTGSFSAKTKEVEEESPRTESVPAKAKDAEQETPRRGSQSLKSKPDKPKVEKPRPRPKSSGAIIDFGLNPGQHLLESGLTHLNKERATRPKGRRPPSKASVLAHLVIEESIISEDPPDDEDDVKEKKSNNQLQAPPRPRPRSLQPSDTASIDHDSKVVRSGSIPHSASLSVKPKPSKPDVETKPEVKKSPKPEAPAKENSIKKPRVPMGIAMPGMPGMAGLFKRDKSPSVKRKDEEAKETDSPSKEKEDEEAKHEDKSETVKTESEEPVPKPKPKYKPPGGVPFLGGAMGLGGQLMAEMKKKQNRKDAQEKETKEVPKTSPKAEPKTSSEAEPKAPPKPEPKISPKAAPRQPKPTPSVRKPPPPAKLSKEKRKSLIVDSGAKPVLGDRPDGGSVMPKEEPESTVDKATTEVQTGDSADVEDGTKQRDSKLSETGIMEDPETTPTADSGKRKSVTEGTDCNANKDNIESDEGGRSEMKLNEEEDNKSESIINNNMDTADVAS